jgi:hypothetical protein
VSGALVQLGRRPIFAAIDMRDWPAVSARRWFLKRDPTARRTDYAYSYERDEHGRRRKVLLHVFLWRLWGRRPADVIDHANGDGLDCRRRNLRRATFAQNNANHPRRVDNKSGCKGVDWDKRSSKWRVRIQSNGVRTLVGHFDDREGAIRCYQRRARAVHGRFARGGGAVSPRVAPVQKPGRSWQAVGTPRALLDAVELRYGRIAFDLAADTDNRVVPLYFGPGSPLGEDALARDWSLIGGDGPLWLNPPFGNISPFAKKCAQHRHEKTIAMLVPLTTANWARDYVFPFAFVRGLNPRVTFVGHSQAFPKDVMVCVYGPGVPPGFDCWRWRP